MPAASLINSAPSSPELSLLSLDEDLIPIRPCKPAGQISLDFSGLLNPPLLLHEDLKEGCGGQLWPAGMVLAKYILKDLGIVRGKVVLELGAGGGLVGLALAKALASTDIISGTPPILITDLPILLQLQHRNISINNLSSLSILSKELSWGSPLPESISDVYRRPDVILAADCVYYEPAFPLLLETLGDLMTPNVSGASDDLDPTRKAESVCYFCIKKRRKADTRFITTLKKRFTVQELDAKEIIAEEGGGVFLYQVSRK